MRFSLFSPPSRTAEITRFEWKTYENVKIMRDLNCVFIFRFAHGETKISYQIELNRYNYKLIRFYHKMMTFKIYYGFFEPFIFHIYIRKLTRNS